MNITSKIIFITTIVFVIVWEFFFLNYIRGDAGFILTILSYFFHLGFMILCALIVITFQILIFIKKIDFRLNKKSIFLIWVSVGIQVFGYYWLDI